MAAYEPVQKHKVTPGIPGWLNKLVCKPHNTTLNWTPPWLTTMTTLRDIDSFRPWQHGWNFADKILNCIFLNGNIWIFIKISVKFVSKGTMNNIPAFAQIMACQWQRSYWCIYMSLGLNELKALIYSSYQHYEWPTWWTILLRVWCYQSNIPFAHELSCVLGPCVQEVPAMKQILWWNCQTFWLICYLEGKAKLTIPQTPVSGSCYLPQ